MTGHGRRRPPASPRHHVGGAPSTPSTPPPAPRRRAGDDLHGRQREDVVGAGGGHYATVSTATDTVKRTAGAAGARSRGAGTGASSRRKRRPACDMGFTHLGRDSVRAATELVAACRDGERTLPAGIISRYHPSSSCICRRPDCFYEFFRAATKDGERRNCHSCPAAGRAEKRWYKVPPGDGGGTGKWQCHACYKRELAERDETGGTSSNGPAVILLDPPLQHPMKKVREEVEGSVAAGNVVYWEDVYLRLAEERKAVFGQETSSKYGRDIVRKMFYAISEAGGSKARVVSEEGDTIGVDGRERILCLLPNDLRDDLILKIVLETREAAKKEGKSALERALKRTEDNPEDVDARMAVMTSAGAIVRQDVQADKSLQNAPARGEKHRYAQELAMPVKPVRQALAGYPSTLVGMLQSVTLMGLQGDVVGGDPKATQPAWVWDETWASDALTDAEEEDPDFGGDDRVSPSPPAAESVSDEAAARIEKENVKRRSRGRVLLMQFVSLVKGVLGEEVGTFDDASKLKRRSELTYDDIVEGPDVREGEQRDEAFWRKPGLAAVDSATSSLEGTEAFTCVECKLREIVKPQPRASTKVDYLFIQRGGTKAFHDNKAAVAIPLVCFAVCIAFQAWEFLGPKNHPDACRARVLFTAVRAGWVKDNFMKGQAAVNTTRDYIRAALFFANTAILLTTFAVGYAGSRYTDCSTDDNSCSAEDYLLIVKLGALAALLMTIFFVFTQCTRYAVHFSFCINTTELGGVPMPMSLMVKVFNHAHKYYSLGIRLYFGTIPVFAWIFTSWALLAVTPVYVFMVRGLENAGFVQEELDEISRLQAALPSSSLQPPPPQGAEVKQHTV
eukprot:g15355.t1